MSFDCSVINRWNVGLMTVWDCKSHSTHWRTVTPSPLVSSALASVEGGKHVAVLSTAVPSRVFGTLKMPQRKSTDGRSVSRCSDSLSHLTTSRIVNLPGLCASTGARRSHIADRHETTSATGNLNFQQHRLFFHFSGPTQK